jgi:ABC-type glycerol-3-phosphate transport system substrate-binding protein
LIIAALLVPLATCNSKLESVSFMAFGDPAELAAYETLVDNLQEEHADIAIELIHIPSQSDYHKRLAADLAVGAPADAVDLQSTLWGAESGAQFPGAANARLADRWLQKALLGEHAQPEN